MENYYNEILKKYYLERKKQRLHPLNIKPALNNFSNKLCPTRQYRNTYVVRQASNSPSCSRIDLYNEKSMPTNNIFGADNTTYELTTKYNNYTDLTSRHMDYEIGSMLSFSSTYGIGSFTDQYYLVELSKHYPVSITQNELITLTEDNIEAIIEFLSELDSIYSKEGINIFSNIEIIDMLDYTIYRNDYLLLAFNKTFCKTVSKADNTNKEVAVTTVAGFCKLELLNVYGEQLSQLCNGMEKIIKDAKLNTNHTFKYIDDLKSEYKTMETLKPSGNGFVLETVVITKKSIDKLDYDFYPYLDLPLLIEEFSKTDDKLLIMHGIQGTGKSKLAYIMAHAMSEDYDYNIINFAGKYGNKIEAWSTIEAQVDESNRDNKQTLIIIDDLEPSLMNRSNKSDSENIFFTNLLTILDGTIDNNVKVIITTNYIIEEETDAPLYRSGRLFDKIYTHTLEQEEVVKLFKKYKVPSNKSKEFLARKQDTYTQSDVAQVIYDNRQQVSRSYYKKRTVDGVKKVNKIGFNK